MPTGDRANEPPDRVALKAGDEARFACADATRTAPSLLRVAMTYVASRAVAEEVVQETWLGVHRRDSTASRAARRCKTWIFRILTNTRQHARRSASGACVPFSVARRGRRGRRRAVGRPRSLLPARPCPLSRPLGASAPTRVGDARGAPPVGRDPRGDPARRSSGSRRRSATVDHAARRRGLAAEEVCDALELSDGNQRVLLHRARSKVRGALERHLNPLELPA